jgi:hypothetical protein
VTLQEFVSSPEVGITACKVVAGFNLATSLANLYLSKFGQFGIGIASIGLCWGGVLIFREGIKMREQNKEMNDIRVKLEADIWEMEHGPTSPHEQ